MTIDDLLRGLARTAADVPEGAGQELREEFIRACRRLDDDPREQQRINDIADLLDAEESLYTGAVAAIERGEQHTALPLLRQCAQAGTGEASWLLAQLLEDLGRTGEAIIWYQRAADDGDPRAADKLAGLHARQFPLAGSAAGQLVMDAGRGRSSAGVNTADGSPHWQLTGPAMVRGRDISRAMCGAMDTSRWLAAPGRDLRVMNPGGREETQAMIARLHELLRRCPPWTFGNEASAAVLAEVATVSEGLIADRDERTALRLIRAAVPHLVYLGRRHPAAFEVRRARADAWCELGHYRRAEMLLRWLSDDEERVFGSDDPRTALLLLWTLMGSGQLRQAEAGFRALEARLARPQSASTLMLWHLQCRYSWLLGQQGLVSESAMGYDGVIINRSHELGAYHADTSDARHSKGKMLVVGGYGPEAVTLLQAVADDRVRVQGDRHSDTLETFKYLHLAHVQTEPRDDRVVDCAIGALEEILHIQDERHGPAYPMSHDTAEQLRRLIQLREAIRFREPIPDLRQVPAPSIGQDRVIPLPSHGTITRLPER